MAAGMDDPGLERVSTLLVQWQSTADESHFAELFTAVRPIIEDAACRALRSSRIADPSAVDDCLAMVLDHLRRLPGTAPGERSVAPFRSAGSESGVGFVRWLAKERARDVARTRRRRARLATTFSQLGPSDAVSLRHAAVEPTEDRRPAERMRRAIGELDIRSRDVLTRLIDGETQAAIAKSMGVCEGTVSRIRTKAIDAIRRSLADDRPRPK